MKIFIICCLLFIHVNMCIFIRGFRVSIRVSGIRGFGFGDGFPPESVSGSGSGFDFGFRFWVHGDFTRSEPDPLPFLHPAECCIGPRVLYITRVAKWLFIASARCSWVGYILIRPNNIWSAHGPAYYYALWSV